MACGLPPIKLLDSYRFLINGQPFPSANMFTSGAGYVEFEYPETNGLQITRTVFAPDGIPAVLVGLSLRNASNQTQSFRLLLEATSELIAAYPGREPRQLRTKFTSRTGSASNRSLPDCFSAHLISRFTHS